MAASDSGPGDVFDVKRIRRLVKLMEEHNLGEIDLKQGEQGIRICRGPSGAISTVVAPAPPPVAGGTPTAAPQDEANTAYVTSPMIGTFYAAASPDASPFVKVGDPIGPESTVCIVEAMKVFNEIPAETSGRIVAVLVENGDPVEFGQRLFKVDTSV